MMHGSIGVAFIFTLLNGVKATGEWGDSNHQKVKSCDARLYRDNDL